MRPCASRGTGRAMARCRRCALPSRRASLERWALAGQRRSPRRTCKTCARVRASTGAHSRTHKQCTRKNCAALARQASAFTRSNTATRPSQGPRVPRAPSNWQTPGALCPTHPLPTHTHTHRPSRRGAQAQECPILRAGRALLLGDRGNRGRAPLLRDRGNRGRPPRARHPGCRTSTAACRS